MDKAQYIILIAVLECERSYFLVFRYLASEKGMPAKYLKVSL